jgi:hypothetical protein
MALELNVSLDSRNLARFRRLMQASRLVAAQSLTFTAERAKPAWIAGHRVFHRRNSWIDRGVRMRAATPGNLVAKVGTIDRYMGRHIVGVGDPKEGRLFVPLYSNIADVPTHTKVRARLRAMARTQTKPFWINGTLYRRKGKARTPLVVLGKMQQGAHMKPELDALAIVDRVVQREFPTVYERLLLKWAERG